MELEVQGAIFLAVVLTTVHVELLEEIVWEDFLDGIFPPLKSSHYNPKVEILEEILWENDLKWLI